MTIQVGDRLPDVPLAIATAEGPRPTTSGEYFAGKRVALFAVPGAFTPTCSARHLPSYVEKAGELKGKGVDEIACISVNDPFEVSDADTMLDYINPKAGRPDQVAILTREGCAFCAKAKARLGDAGYDYVEIPLSHAIRTKAIGAIAGAQTVPQVFINGRLIGGTAELEAYLRKAA
jgi:glutaredoxin-like protein